MITTSLRTPSGQTRNAPTANTEGGPTELQHRYTEANGFRLHYVVAGDGPPMVLLHGDSASALDWQWVLPELARNGRVHALDFPGHGDSAKPRAAYSPTLFTDTVIAFLDALGIERAILVGHSLGGWLPSALPCASATGSVRCA